jgi:tetratricopeptide (TPR) repeat protein
MGRRLRITSMTTIAIVVAAAVLLGGAVSSETAPPGAASNADVARAAEHLDRARTTARFAELTLAEQALAEAERGAGESAEGLTVAADLANYRHRFSTGLALARRALALEPENTSALGARVDALLELGRYRSGVKALDRLVELEPGAPAYTRVAQARQLLGRPAAAIEAARLAVEAAAGEPRLEAFERVYLASLLANRGRLGLAEDELHTALAARAGYAPARSGLADIAASRGHHRRAVTLFRRVFARTPSPTYAEGLATALAALGDEEGSGAAYALAERRAAAFARHGGSDELGSALLDLDRDLRVRDALERARRGRRLRPSIEGDHVLAWALYKNGRCREAQRYSRRALRFGTEDLDAIYHRTLIERCVGNDAASRRFRARLRGINRHYLDAPPSAWRIRR